MSGPGDFWTQEEWSEWSNSLAFLIPEGDESRYSNPDGAQESIIEDCLRAYVAERSTTSSRNPEPLFLVCQSCGEAFNSIVAAYEHGVFIPGPDPSWCGENGFLILPESEAF